jgi:putative ABC transport system permease protein
MKKALKPHLVLIAWIGVIVPRRLRADWRQEWEAELRFRELLLADWDKLNWKTKFDLLRRSLGGFWDALLLQPKRLEDEMFQDLRYGVRMLVKNPGFTFVAVLTLALGIGANTAIFSIVNAVLLQPLPFSEPDRLVWTWGNIRNGGNRASVSPLDYLDYRAQNTTFEHFAATFSFPASFNLTGSGDPERLQGQAATGDFFQALGVNAATGHTFLLENEEPGRDQVVVLSYKLWQRRFGGDPSLIGKTIALDGKSFEVIGVMPASFNFPRDAELWTPMNFQIAPGMKQRKAHFLRPVGRLKDGVTLAQAQADMDAVASRLEAQYPESDTGWNLRMVPLREQLVGNIRPTLRVLFGAVGLVLLIACANVANLLLVRASSRQKEIAVRIALGAGRFRIVRQMLTESMLLALAGGALGVWLASWGVNLLVAFSGNDIPPTSRVGIDGAVLAFTLGVSLVTGVLFGLVPALPAIQAVKLSETLKEGGRSGGQGSSRNRTRSLLVVLETAFAVVLLIGAGLLIRSFIRLQGVGPGFDAANVLTLRIDLPQQKYNLPEKAGSFWGQLHERLAALPGVEAVGMNTELPLSGQPNDTPFTVEGRPPVQANQQFGADFRRINEDYLRALRIPLKRGREFSAQEVRQSAHVVLISEALADGVFPGEDPLGKRLLLGLDAKTPFEIIGIVGDIRHRTLEAQPFATMYLPVLSGSANLTIRVAGDPLSLAAAVRKEVQAIDSDQPIAALRTMEQVVAESVGASRYRTMLLGLFAFVALLLAAIGIYGVVSYTVAQRTHEIGIRMALGAQPRAVQRLVIGQGIRLALVGVGAGLIGAAGLTRVLVGLLFGVTATDPLTFVGVAVVLMLIALVACWIPARRAARVDPMMALRHE